jgi:hypothetical protein
MILTRSFLALALVAPLLAEPAMTDRITPEQLAAKDQQSPLLALPQLKSPDEVKVKNSADESLLGTSDILSDGTHWTLVPKGAVLHTPAAMAKRVGVEPVGQLLVWSDFLNVNRAWLQAEEISYEQATGKIPLVAEHAAFWPKQGKVIVAVHLGGPISVRTSPPSPAAR